MPYHSNKSKKQPEPSKQRQLGLNFHEQTGPGILVFAPEAKRLSLEAENRKPVHLRRIHGDYWQADCPELVHGDRYMLRLNHRRLLPDPCSLAQPGGVHGASMAINLNLIRHIHSEKWQGTPLRDLIIYELHTGTFSPQGTFEGIKERLPYLKKLGINAIELMPVASFPGRRNWGYDGVFPFSVQQSYGGALELARLVKACHDLKLAVILDVVYNHLGPEGNYLNAFAPYLTGKYRTPWGKAVNFDDSYSDGVRRFFLENAMMWLRDFHIDGLRLDAVHSIYDAQKPHFLQELSENVRLLNEKARQHHFLIAESDRVRHSVVNPVEKGGFGLNAQWYDSWHHALHALITGERQGYYAKFGSLNHLTECFRHANQRYPSKHPVPYDTSASDESGNFGDKLVIFTQNHDQTGNRPKGERLGSLVDFETLKLAAAAMLLSPCIPMIFMGEEFAASTPFPYFVDHGSNDLLEKVRKGRKKEFAKFGWTNAPPDPGSEDTFLASKLNWHEINTSPKKHMLAFYKKLIALRKQQPLLQIRNNDRRVIRQVRNTEVVIVSRILPDKNLRIVMNFSENTTQIKIPEPSNTPPRLLLYSAHRQWGGRFENITNPVIIDGKKLFLKMSGRSVAVLK